MLWTKLDTVTGKIELVMQAQKSNTPIISCMGAGNKMDASAFEVADIYKTSGCPLARVMRRELKKRRVRHLKVVYSKEPAMTPVDEMAISCKDKLHLPARNSAEMYSEETGPRKQCVRACGCWADRGR